MTRTSLWIGLLVSFSSCHGGRWEQGSVVIKENRVLVETERWGGEADEEKSGYAHPVAVDALSLSKVLSALRYRATRRAEPKGFVVAEGLAGTLAQAIADGLAGADSHDRVRFAVLNPDTMIFLPASNLTRGIAYVRPSGVLHLVFDVVDDDAEEFNFGRWGHPVKRVLSTVYLEPGPDTKLYVHRGDTRRTWVTTRVVEAAPELVEAAGEPIAPDPESVAPEGRDPDPGSKRQETRIRLELLDELYREGLIGERAYQEKRKEIDRD